MNPMLQVEPPVNDQVPEDDPYRYGWRYVRIKQPDGTEVVDQVPLTWEGVLYPEEDDFVVQKPPHARDCHYCFGSLETFYHEQQDIVVLYDCRVDWGVQGLRPLGPDILVIFDVHQWLQEGTFRFTVEGGRPILVLEITSPSTYYQDLQHKPTLYYRAGVQKFVIVDRGPRGENPAQLRGYQRGPTDWVPLPPDAQGRLDLAPVGLLLGLEGDRPWLYDAATGQRLPDRTELTLALAASERQTHVEAEARAAAEAQARREAEAREVLEKRLRELEDQLHRQGGSGGE